MKIKLPKDYSPEKLEVEINKALNEMENRIVEGRKVKRITTAGSNPQDMPEQELRLYRDGTTKEVIFRDEGQLYVISTTKR